MKKLLLAFLIGSATLAVTSSCTKEYYDTVPSITKIAKKSANQWQTDEDERLFVEVAVPELTDYYVDQGIVNVAISFDNETFYHAIPTTFDGISYSYDYTTGSVGIYAQDPLFEEGIVITPPANLVIKISLTEADYVK